MSENVNLNTVKEIYKIKYDQFLEKKSIRTILEIGDNILPHCEFWKSYLKDTNIIGIDISTTPEKNEIIKDNITILKMNNYLDYEVLFYLGQYSKKFDLIIFNKGQTLDTCNKFLSIYSNLLEEDGLLFIENIGDMSWKNDLLDNFSQLDYPKHKIKIYDLSLKINPKNYFLLVISNLDIDKIKIKVVYFAYLVPNKWMDIINEQLTGLMECGLYQESKNIYLSVISEENELNILKNFLSLHFPKVELINLFKDNYFEYPGIKTIYDISENDDNTFLLYFHSKGMTSNMHLQRHKLFHYTIKTYKDWINKFVLDFNLDVIGIIPHPSGLVYYNYWWVRSSYIYNYWQKPEVVSNRFIWELWLGNIYSFKKTVYSWSPLSLYNTNTSNIVDSHTADNILNKILP